VLTRTIVSHDGFWTLACCGNCMTPVDKTPEKEKESAEGTADLRHEWVQEDIKDEGRKPDLEEIEEDDRFFRFPALTLVI